MKNQCGKGSWCHISKRKRTKQEKKSSGRSPPEGYSSGTYSSSGPCRSLWASTFGETCAWGWIEHATWADSTQISPISPQTGCGKAARIYKGNLVKRDPSETCFLNTCIPKLHETWASDRPRKITTELKLVYLSDNDTFLRVSWDHAFRCLSATKDTFPSLHSSLESWAGFCRPSEHASDTAMTRNRSFHAPCLVVWNIYFSIYWESYSQLTFIFSYFSERFKPPTSS